MRKQILNMCLTAILMVASLSSYALSQINGVYQIGTANDLEAFADLVNMGMNSANAVLVSDIDMSTLTSWTAIGDWNTGAVTSAYCGHFDGQGHKISNFGKYDEEEDTYSLAFVGDRQGFFGFVKNATIKNFSIDGAFTYDGGTGYGAIGWAEGSTLQNIHSALNIASVSTSHHIGGVCGDMRAGSKAIGCSFSGTITDSHNSHDCIGGIGGYSNVNCLYEDCANYGTVNFTASNAYAGGICGYVNNDSFIGIFNCLNVGKVALKDGTPTYSGAFVGRLRTHANSKFENNYMLQGSAQNTSGENRIEAGVVTTEQLASGEVCYKLNGDQTEINWYQTLMEDPYPVLAPTHMRVFYNGAIYYNGNGDIFYTVSPSTWTNVPTTDITQGSRTYQGGLLQAMATVSGRTATFTLKKNDGSQFQNRGHIVVHFGSVDGTIVKSNVSFEAGISNPTVDVDLDFTSGKRKYVIIIKDADQYYYTKPIAITANGSSSDADLVISGGSFFNTPILTTGKEFPFNLEIKNNGSESWSGSFFLKCGREEWLQWDNVIIGIGGTKTLTKSYTPNSSGCKTLTLCYRTGGSGSSMEVDGGDYDNPFTITVADPPSSDKLATPDKNTFTATNLTETGFTASWGAVDGALYYDINVRKVGGDYASAVFKGGSSTTSIKVTGLNPGTSYQFQIRARNNNNSQNSDWSASIPDAVTTKKAGTEPANLSIYAFRGFDGTTPLTVGVASTYKVYVVNNGASDWYGSFYLKDGDTNLKAWHNIALMGNAKAVQPLEYDYVPESAGEKTLTLYYQTNTSGGGRPVNAGSGTNPMTINVTSDSSVNKNLQLKSAIVYPETIEIGQTGTISAEVQNTGDKDWYGTFYLIDNGVTITTVDNLAKGKSKNIFTNSWEPQTAGTHTIAVYYESTNSNRQRLVSTNGFTNPVTVEVTSDNTEIASQEVYIHHISEDVVPKAIPAGAEILYHFRVTNKNNIPVKGVVGQFNVEVTSTTGNKRNYIFTSDPSGYNGVIFLALHTSDLSTVINSGESAIIQCKKIYKQLDECIILNEDTLKPITLSIKDDALFSKIEEFKITLDVGASGKLSAGNTDLITNPLGNDKELASLKGSLSLPVSYTLKKNDEGKISKIGIESGINGKLDAAVNIGDWLSFDTEGYIGAKAKNTFSIDDKRAIWMAVANGYEAMTFHTNSWTLIAARAFCNWFHKKPIEVETSNSWFVGYSVGASANLSKAFPTIHSKLLNKLSLPSSFWFDDENLFKVEAKATAKWEPDKYKTIDINNKEYGVYGEGRSLMLKMDNFLTSRVPAYFLAKKSYWNGDLANKYFSNYGLDVFFVSSKAKLSGAFTVMEEEFYTDSKKQDLYSISNTVEISTSDEIGLNDIPYLGPWLGNRGLKANLTSAVTLSSKLESKGDFARYLQNTSNTLLGANLSKIFPALSGESIIGAPRTHFEAFSDDLIGTIRHLPTGSKEFPLKESLKLEQKVKSEFEASVSIPFHPGGKLQWNIDARLAFECESYPSETYYSVKDKQFIPVVLQPSSTIANELDGLVAKINNRLNGSETFNNTERKEIDDQYDWELQSAKCGPGSAASEPGLTFLYDDAHYVLLNDSWANARIKRLHPRLVPEEQNDICKMSFTLNEDKQSFDSNVSLDFGHYYPAGELLGITDQGDTLFVVSEVCNLRAYNEQDTLSLVQHGNMRIETTVGIDDLTPFGFSEDTPLDVYYAEEGSEIWHYVGPAGTTIMTDKLGAYMMATSIKNDVIVPEILADMDEESGILRIKVNENIGLRVNTLNVLINGMKRDVSAINESNFEISLSEEDMEYMLTLYVTINDLAGNQGSLFQIFNIDKDDPDSIKTVETEKDRTEIYLSKNMLKVKDAEPDATFMLFSIKGDVIAKGKTDDSGNAQIHLNHLTTGVYVVTLSNGKAKKFLIK